MKLAADDVQTVVLPGSGHWVAEQAPEQLLAALTAFLAPYRDAAAAVHNPSPQLPGTSCRPGRSRPAPKRAAHASRRSSAAVRRQPSREVETYVQRN